VEIPNYVGTSPRFGVPNGFIPIVSWKHQTGLDIPHQLEFQYSKHTTGVPILQSVLELELVGIKKMSSFTFTRCENFSH
jgi:hypothetical protein